MSTVPIVYSTPVHFTDEVVMTGTAHLPNSSITNAMVSSSAAIDATKMEHQFPLRYSQPSDVTAFSHTEVVHAVDGTSGTIVNVDAGSVAICGGDASVTVDVLKDGVSILSGAIELDSNNEAYTPETGTINTSTLADSDVLEVKVTALGPDATDSVFTEDFLGDAGDTLPSIWGTNGQTANSTEDYVTDSGCGVYTLTQSSDSEAQASLLSSSDNLWIDLYEKPIVEWRAKLDLTGTNSLGTADQRLVMGIGSALANAEDTLDSVTTSAWFRMEGASDNILVEADDGTANTDDQYSLVDLVDNTWTHFKIDFSDLSDVKFYIDGTEQGGATVSMANISSSTLVQPIFCIQRDAGAEEEKMYFDNFSVTQGRTGGELAKGVYCVVMIREDAS